MEVAPTDTEKMGEAGENARRLGSLPHKLIHVFSYFSAVSH